MGLTGLPFSVFRAGVIFLIMLVGSLLLQPPDSLTALALAAIIMGVQQPFAPCDIGFQLSVCGVLGVLAASALAKRQTQFVQVRYAARHNQRRQTALPLPLAIVLRAVDAVQTAVLATLATLPVLLLHGMAASGAAVPANLLVVWLLGPALRLGILALVLSFVPVLDPLFHGASLLLGIVLRLIDHPGRLVRGSAGGTHCPAGAVYFVGAGCFCCAGGAFLAYPAAAPLCARWLCVHSGSRYGWAAPCSAMSTPGHGGHRGQWLRGGGAE